MNSLIIASGSKAACSREDSNNLMAMLTQRLSHGVYICRDLVTVEFALNNERDEPYCEMT